MTNKLEPNYFYVYRLKSTIPDYIFISYQAFKDLAGYQNQINTASYDLILQGELDEKETPSDLYNRIHKKCSIIISNSVYEPVMFLFSKAMERYSPST